MVERPKLVDKTNASEFSTTSTVKGSPPSTPSLKTAQSRGIRSRLSQYIKFVLSSFKSQWALTLITRHRKYAHTQKHSPFVPLSSSFVLLLLRSHPYTSVIFSPLNITSAGLADRPALVLWTCLFFPIISRVHSCTSCINLWLCASHRIEI